MIDKYFRLSKSRDLIKTKIYSNEIIEKSYKYFKKLDQQLSADIIILFGQILNKKFDFKIKKYGIKFHQTQSIYEEYLFDKIIKNIEKNFSRNEELINQIKLIRNEKYNKSLFKFNENENFPQNSCLGDDPYLLEVIKNHSVLLNFEEGIEIFLNHANYDVYWIIKGEIIANGVDAWTRNISNKLLIENDFITPEGFLTKNSNFQMRFISKTEVSILKINSEVLNRIPRDKLIKVKESMWKSLIFNEMFDSITQMSDKFISRTKILLKEHDLPSIDDIEVIEIQISTADLDSKTENSALESINSGQLDLIFHIWNSNNKMRYEPKFIDSVRLEEEKFLGLQVFGVIRHKKEIYRLFDELIDNE